MTILEWILLPIALLLWIMFIAFIWAFFSGLRKMKKEQTNDKPNRDN